MTQPNEVVVLPPVQLSQIRVQDPVPINLGPGGDGTTWWGGNGPPTDIPGSEPGDHYIDYNDGRTYKLI